MCSNEISAVEVLQFDQFVDHVIEYESVILFAFDAVMAHAERVKKDWLAGRITLTGATLSFKSEVIRLNEEAIRRLEQI